MEKFLWTLLEESIDFETENFCCIDVVEENKDSLVIRIMDEDYDFSK